MMQQRKNQLPVRHTLKAYERLKRQKLIDTLFSQGKAYSVFPITVKYLSVVKDASDTSSVKVGFTVSKKKFKHAVKRNKVKRWMREAWRLNKYLLSALPEERQLQLFFIYTSSQLSSFSEVEVAVVKCISKLNTNGHA